MSETDHDFSVLIRPILARLSLEISPSQLSLLEQHYAALRKWNERINLTSIRSPQQIATRHFGESLFVATRIGGDARTLVDVGSGAGFPGLPIAVLRPRLEVTLVESTAKKVAFLKEIGRSLTNVRVFHGRLEQLVEEFDWATVRGVNPGKILPTVASIAEQVAFLIGQAEVRELEGSKLFNWAPVENLPWGERRVLLVGRRDDR